MVDALVNLLTGAGILFVIFAAWLGVQHWARKTDHRPPDCDMLDRPEKGCGHCQLRGKCDMEVKKEYRSRSIRTGGHLERFYGD